MGKDYERICEWGNLYDAYLKARRGKRWKNSVAKVEASALEAVALIQRELQTRTYRPGGYRAFYVYEPKRRLIQTNSFKDKIVQHAFCDQVLYDALTKPFILDNYGSQVGKGTHFGLNRLRDFMREYYRKNGFSADGWVLKADVRHYFQSIRPDVLKKDVATEAFAYMSDEARDDLVNAFSDVELVSAIEEMSLDDAADLLEDMPAGVVKRVLEKSSRQTRESLNKLLNYPESSAGSLMTPEYVRLREEMTVSDAFAAIRRQGENAETVYTCYVVERNRLKGVVSARSLLLADPSTPITDIMDDNVVAVKVTDDQEFVAREMQRYDFTAMPVVDNEGMFVGIITIDDAIDVLTDESTEDMQKMAAILPDDDATTYFGTSVWTHAKQRIPWLLILMLSATFTGMVTTHYEEAFVSLPLLVSFMPMLMDTAGNCGNQISTLMVRGLALGEVEPADFLKVLAKELRVSAIVGAVLGLVNGLRIYLMYTFIFAGQYDNVMGYAIVVSVSLFFSVILAKLVGGMLPLAAKKLGADPAIMATPFITTIVDACSLILYFQIAQLVFRNMM